MIYGQVVSINKTSPPGAYMDFLDIRELEVFGFEPGKDAYLSINKLRPRQDGRHFPDDIFKCIFLNENV